MLRISRKFIKIRSLRLFSILRKCFGLFILLSFPKRYNIILTYPFFSHTILDNSSSENANIELSNSLVNSEIAMSLGLSGINIVDSSYLHSTEL